MDPVCVDLVRDGLFTSPASDGYGALEILCPWMESLIARRGSPVILYPAPRGFDDLQTSAAAMIGRRGLPVRAVQRVGRRHDADQDQHDEAHALLTVV